MKPPHLSALLLGVLALSGGCERETGAPRAVRGGEVVVYATVADADYLQHLFAAWSDSSGVRVSVRHGSAPRIVDEVIGNTVNPPADLLWTAGVEGVWRAADEGALRPVLTAAVAEGVPGWLRDPDGYWVATGFAQAIIVYADRRLDRPPPDYAALAESRLDDGLCLSSAAEPINRAVVAGLIDQLGIRAAEIAVRGWMANLAAPVFGTGADLLDAVSAGDCAVGIVSSAALARHDRSDSLAVFVPADARVQVDAIGVARHARNPDAALALLEWLTSPSVQLRQAETRRVFPALSDVWLADIYGDAAAALGLPADAVGASVRHAEAARLLAERAAYR